MAKSEFGELNVGIYSYVRYLNQLGLNDSYTDAFGNTRVVQRRQDVQLNKVKIQFQGWVMEPRFRYLFYVWTNNSAQGLGAQVVVAGNIMYLFNSHLRLGGGVFGLPGVRTTEGNFPYWLTIDNRAIADEFFRPSYTMGFFALGEIVERLQYSTMIGNNLSQLGIDGGQLDNKFNTFSAGIAWYPTTGEFGKLGRSPYGDFDGHENVATRFAAHYTQSTEDRQGQPNTDAFDNVQIRLSDGNIIFAPNLFGPGIQIDNVTYHMSSVDAGIKHKGFSLEGEFYWRWLNTFNGTGTENLSFDHLVDHGIQLLASSMVVPKTVQLYAIWSRIFGQYGVPWDLRGGVNVYPFENQVFRCNLEYMYANGSPVGGASLPYQVGSTGSIVHVTFQIDF